MTSYPGILLTCHHNFRFWFLVRDGLRHTVRRSAQSVPPRLTQLNQIAHSKYRTRQNKEEDEVEVKPWKCMKQWSCRRTIQSFSTLWHLICEKLPIPRSPNKTTTRQLGWKVGITAPKVNTTENTRNKRRPGALLEICAPSLFTFCNHVGRNGGRAIQRPECSENTLRVIGRYF